MAFDFAPYAAVLLDLDGTVSQEEHPLPGAVELLQRLEKSKKKFACLSNNNASPAQVADRLAKMGVRLDESHIYTAGAAAADYVLHTWRQRRPQVFNLATQGVKDLLEGKVEWTESVTQACDAVVIGTPSNQFATEERQRMAVALARKGATLVGTSADRRYTSPRGIEIGAGALTQMIAYAADATAVFTGKPQPLFFHELCEKLDVAPAKCLLIGDNPESDLAGARGVNMQCILALTGVVSRADLDSIPAHLKPDFVVNDLTELL
jgi:HAD superfamily hydrolase (TIGR01450 family)